MSESINAALQALKAALVAIPFTGTHLDLPTCPHCGRANPTLQATWGAETGNIYQTQDHARTTLRAWKIYECRRCGGVVLACSNDGQRVLDYWPKSRMFSDDIPARPRQFLTEAADSLSSPSASMMMSNSAVDSMLKARGLTEGNVSSRIGKAVTGGLLTREMAQWAHEVRLDANSERHADEVQDLPTTEDSTRALDFATALAEILFVLPARVTRTISEVQKPNNE